jgi:hypothetical protein
MNWITKNCQQLEITRKSKQVKTRRDFEEKGIRVECAATVERQKKSTLLSVTPFGFLGEDVGP